MKRFFKRTQKVLLTSLSILLIFSGCSSGGGNTTPNAGNGSPAPSASGGDSQTGNSASSITFFHTKGEIHQNLEEMARIYEDQTGVHVEIQVAGAGESPYTRITTMYNSGTPPTMAMLDTNDIIVMSQSKALDLSNEAWVDACGDNVMKVDGKVYSFPFCVEGRGIIYNKKAIENTLGTSFDPDSINSRDALAALLQSLRDNGMENPMVISKEDWSLGAHQLQYIYELQDGTNDGTHAYIEEIKAGNIDLMTEDRFNGFIDTLDLLLEYNYNKKDPLGAVYERDPIHLVDEEAALWFNGVWAWPNIAEAGASVSDEFGFLPYVVSNDTSDFANTSIQAAPSKQVMIDSEKATPEEQQAAKDFLNWLVSDPAGQVALVEGCALIPAFATSEASVSDPLGADIMDKMTNGRTFPVSTITPGDHWSVIGGAMQKYIARQSSREELAAAITSYWAAQN